MTDFTQLVQNVLSKIATIIDHQCADFAEAEFQGDVLIINLDDGKQYVLNRNLIHQQLWLSSPLSGAWHFIFNTQNNSWKSTRSDDVLEHILTDEFSKLKGHEVLFQSLA